MPIDYDSDSTLNASLQRTAEGYAEFEDLSTHNVRLKAILKIKLNKDGELQEIKGSTVDVKPINGLMKALADMADYVIVVDKHFWIHSEERQKDALMHGALMQLVVTVDANGNVKVKKRKPDIIEFSQTLRVFGAYDDRMLRLQQVIVNGAATAAQATARAVRGRIAPSTATVRQGEEE